MKKIIESQITLLSHSGNTISPIRICYDDDEVEISLEYSGTRYQGMGTDFMWADAFWDLQRKLPDGTSLACCMTCKHGNMCPYGNVENQLFCTKDALITSKHDMIDLIYRDKSFYDRVVATFDYCNDFVCQSDDHYTYSDYYYLRKKDL